MNKISYQIGDLLYHPGLHGLGQYAVVVKVFGKVRNLPSYHAKGPGFGIIWSHFPGKIYEFNNDEQYATVKGFQLAATANKD